MEKGKKIGEGTYGIVYSAKSPRSGSNYAIKRNLADESISFVSVLRETDILVRLRDENICNLKKVYFGEPFSDSCFSPLSGKDKLNMKDVGVNYVFDKASFDLFHFCLQKCHL